VAKEYRLIPAEVPHKQKGGKNVYASILDEFSASDEASVRVDVAGRKATSVAIGLRNAIKAAGLHFTVHRRGAEVFLTTNLGPSGYE